MLDDTLPADSGAEAPRIVVTTPSDQLAYAQSLLPGDEDTAPEADPDATEPDEGSDSDPSTEEPADEPEAKAKPPRGVQKRIDELVKDREDARRRADAVSAQLERALAMLERQGQPPPATPADANAPPDPERYTEGELDRGYIRDLARFEARQEMAAFTAQQERQRAVAEIRAREDAARARYPDYNEVVSGERLAPLFQSNPGLVEIIATHESGPDLAYYLGTHPEELAAIARMHPAHAAMRLGQLLPALQPEPPATPKPVSKAPAPITPLRGSGAAPSVNMEAQLEALETAGDYDKWRALKHSARK